MIKMWINIYNYFLVYKLFIEMFKLNSISKLYANEFIYYLSW